MFEPKKEPTGFDAVRLKSCRLLCFLSLGKSDVLALATQRLYVLVDMSHLLRYVDMLRTKFDTLVTTYAVVGLTFARYLTSVADEVSPASFGVVCVHLVARYIAFVDAFVVVLED